MHGEPRPSPAIVPPAIFLASLTDYVNGIIHGRWIQARAPVADLDAHLAQVLATSPWTRRTGEPAEEWTILDHEGFTGGVPGPHDSLAEVAALARWPGDSEGSSW